MEDWNELDENESTNANDSKFDIKHFTADGIEINESAALQADGGR